MPNPPPTPRSTSRIATALALALGLTASQAYADTMPAMPMDHTAHQHAAPPQFAFGTPAPANRATRTIPITMTDFAFTPSNTNSHCSRLSRAMRVGLRAGLAGGGARNQDSIPRVAVSDTWYNVTVHQGDIVRFVITNTTGIHHEFTLGDTATETTHRAEMATMTANDMGPMHDEPNAITVRANETRDLTWKFTQPGQLEYACTIPGHYEVGMRGTIVVQ